MSLLERPFGNQVATSGAEAAGATARAAGRLVKAAAAQRIRVGLTGLAAIFLLVLIAAAGMRPDHSVAPQDSQGEPLAVLGATAVSDLREQAREVLTSVGLRNSDLDKYPHEFSGGQRQRVAIARALITRPRLIVADEPVSALDVSVQAQVLNLMQDLSQQFGVTYLLISHDLAVVDHLCEDVAVIYQGRIVEQGTCDTLFREAAHPYTRALIEAVPRLIPSATPAQRRRIPLIKPREHPATACPYAPRCPNVQTLCDEQRPELRTLTEGHQVACHFEIPGRSDI